MFTKSKPLWYNVLPCNSHHTTRHESLEAVADGEEGSVRTSVVEWHTKPLAGSHGDVHVMLSWRLEDCGWQQVHGARHQQLENIDYQCLGKVTISEGKYHISMDLCKTAIQSAVYLHKAMAMDM